VSHFLLLPLILIFSLLMSLQLLIFICVLFLFSSHPPLLFSIFLQHLLPNIFSSSSSTLSFSFLFYSLILLFLFLPLPRSSCSSPISSPPSFSIPPLLNLVLQNFLLALLFSLFILSSYFSLFYTTPVPTTPHNDYPPPTPCSPLCPTIHHVPLSPPQQLSLRYPQQFNKAHRSPHPHLSLR
jgi:hypothetical protein